MTKLELTAVILFTLIVFTLGFMAGFKTNQDQCLRVVNINVSNDLKYAVDPPASEYPNYPEESLTWYA